MEFDRHGVFDGKIMEVPVHSLLPDKISIIHADQLVRASPRVKNSLEAVIDEMGRRSATAQGLGSIITTVRRMMHTDQRLYISRTEHTVTGILKVGKKKLFIRDAQSGKMNELEPLCVLDFYVHETVQRGGLGRQLFEHMLARERAQPSVLGYDRPSSKLLSFLRRHYQLTDYDPQANNFVVFKNYFSAALRSPDQHGSQRAGSASMGRRAQIKQIARGLESSNHNDDHVSGYGGNSVQCGHGEGKGGSQRASNHAPVEEQKVKYGRGQRDWWPATSSHGGTKEQQESFFMGGSEGPKGYHVGGRRSNLASAPAGLQNHNFFGNDDGALNAQHVGCRPDRRVETAAVLGSENGLRDSAELNAGEDALSSLWGNKGGLQCDRKGSDHGGARDLGRAVQVDVGQSLQEQASRRVSGALVLPTNQLPYKNEQSYGMSSAANPMTWQRSNAVYGKHVQQQEQRDVKQPQRFTPKEEFQQEARVIGGGWKYNPYEHFGCAKVVGDKCSTNALASAALNDRKLGNRLW